MTACPAKPRADEITGRKRGSFPRVYASFAEFERVEHSCLMTTAATTHAPLPDVPLRCTRPTAACGQSTALVVENRTPSKGKRVRSKIHCPRLTPARLRAEGVLEIGSVPDTSILYVQTQVKFYLLHETWIMMSTAP